MILSMTGYGRGELKKENLEILAEVRSLNNRFLDISIRLPGTYSQFEQEVKGIVKQYLNRGRVNVTLTLKHANNLKTNNFKIDRELAQNYFSILNELKSLFNLSGEISLSHFLNLSNIVTYTEEESPQADIWEMMQEALRLSLNDLCQMRQQEGAELAKDLIRRISCLNDYIDQIELRARQRVTSEFEKLKERIQQLIPNKALDPNRLEMEVALLADRIDVTEECIRFRSHSKMFLNTFENEDAGGRRLNFVTQEMNREANTIGAKANDAEIARLVIQIKEELEKIREQVQNIE